MKSPTNVPSPHGEAERREREKLNLEGRSESRLHSQGDRGCDLYLSLSYKAHTQGGSLATGETPPSQGQHSACTGTAA